MCDTYFSRPGMVRSGTLYTSGSTLIASHTTTTLDPSAIPYHRHHNHNNHVHTKPRPRSVMFDLLAPPNAASLALPCLMECDDVTTWKQQIVNGREKSPERGRQLVGNGIGFRFLRRKKRRVLNVRWTSTLVVGPTAPVVI